MKKTFASIIALTITALLGGCSTNSGPSDSAIQKAISATTGRMLKLAEMSSSWQTVEIKSSSVNILRQGNFNEAEKYWPVQAKVSGMSRQQPEFYMGAKPSRDCEFSFSAEFKIKKNDYGDWVAEAPPFGVRPVEVKCQK